MKHWNSNLDVWTDSNVWEPAGTAREQGTVESVGLSAPSQLELFPTVVSADGGNAGRYNSATHKTLPGTIREMFGDPA